MEKACRYTQRHTHKLLSLSARHWAQLWGPRNPLDVLPALVLLPAQRRKQPWGASKLTQPCDVCAGGVPGKGGAVAARLIREALRKEPRQMSQPRRLATTPLDQTAPIQRFSPVPGALPEDVLSLHRGQATSSILWHLCKAAAAVSTCSSKPSGLCTP